MKIAAQPAPGRSARLAIGALPSAASALWGWAFIALACVAWPASALVGYRTVLAVLTIAGFVGAAAGIRRPALGLLAVGLLCTVDAPARILLMTGGTWRWNTFSYWLLVVLVGFAPLVLRWRDVHTRLAELFLVVLVIGLAISPDLGSGIQHTFSLLSVIGLTVYFVRAGNDGSLLHWVGLVCGTTSALGSLAFFLEQASLPYVNPNAFAYLPLTGIFAVCLGFPAAAGRRGGQLILSILAAVNLGCVFLTGSRGAMLVGLTCALFLVASFRGFAVHLTAPLIAVGIVLGFSAQFTPLQEVAVHRVNRLLDPNYSMSERTSGRSDLARASVFLFEQHPLGVGTGGFAARYREVSEIPGFTTFRQGQEIPAHSGWMKTLAENGVLGMLLLSAYVLSFAVVGMRRGDRSQRLIGLLTTAVLAGALASTEFQVKGLWLLAAGATVALQYRTASTGTVRGRNRQRTLATPGTLVADSTATPTRRADAWGHDSARLSAQYNGGLEVVPVEMAAGSPRATP
jgi:O-antigen ligase/polysaccharide polymerase Wzy-like membrane protein